MGGGDGPEDVVGGLFNTLNLNWQSENRFTFLICDAPAHGFKYHKIKGNYDDYPKGSPDKRVLEDVVKCFSEQNIHFIGI